MSLKTVSFSNRKAIEKRVPGYGQIAFHAV